MRHKSLVILFLVMALAACGGAAVPAPAPAPTSAPGRVLFINGDFNPESGYPHARVGDDGAKPESFSQLRREVLEGDLKLVVDELILTSTASITPATLNAYTAAVLGSNSRRLRPAEVDALQKYVTEGGRLLLYADFQFGPDNWASDNDFLETLGIRVFPDNFQPRAKITDTVATHDIMQGVMELEVEGISQFLIPPAAQKNLVIIATCSPLPRSGCALQPAEQAQVKQSDAVACVFALRSGAGRIAGVCDRNPFHNGPQKDGTDINQASNKTFARNLFKWLTSY